jgi:hypothetical protein
MGHWLDKVITLLVAPTANLRELAILAGADPATFYVGTDIGKLDLAGQDIDGMKFSSGDVASDAVQLVLRLKSPEQLQHVSQIVQRIKSAPRQEERIVLLLDEIVRDRSAADALLHCYATDKAKYAAAALRKLEAALRMDASGKRKLNNVQLVKAVTGQFAKAPKTRTTLNYFLYKHLRKYPDLTAWINGRSIFEMYLTPKHSSDLKQIYAKDQSHT